MTETDARSPGELGDPDDLMAGRQGGRGPWPIVVAVAVLLGVAVAAVAVVARGNNADQLEQASVADGGDLGSQSDPLALSEQLAPALADTREGSATGSAPPADAPCADSPSALPEGQADLVYTASVDWEGTPAIVLGYRTQDESLARILLVVAKDDCRLLVTQSF